MFLNKKNLFLFSILALAFLFSANFALAQRSLEVPLLVEVEGVTLTETPILPDYVDYIFNLSVILAALVAFLSVIYGGVRHLTSAGNPATMQDANDQIFAGVIGLIVILGSWILLTTINPQLIVINPQRGGTPEAIEGTGIFLCQTQELSPETCEGPIYSSKSAISDKLNDATSYLIFRNPEGTAYGVVLHKDQYFKGDCEIIISSMATTTQIMTMGPLAGEVSSVSVFNHVISGAGGGVTIYDLAEYETDGKWEYIGPYNKEVTYNDINDAKKYFDNEASSVKIEGSYMVLLCKDKNLEGDCLFLKDSDPNLSNEGFSNNVKSFRVLIGS